MLPANLRGAPANVRILRATCGNGLGTSSGGRALAASLCGSTGVSNRPLPGHPYGAGRAGIAESRDPARLVCCCRSRNAKRQASVLGVPRSLALARCWRYSGRPETRPLRTFSAPRVSTVSPTRRHRGSRVRRQARQTSHRSGEHPWSRSRGTKLRPPVHSSHGGSDVAIRRGIMTACRSSRSIRS